MISSVDHPCASRSLLHGILDFFVIDYEKYTLKYEDKLKISTQEYIIIMYKEYSFLLYF